MVPVYWVRQSSCARCVSPEPPHSRTIVSWNVSVGAVYW